MLLFSIFSFIQNLFYLNFNNLSSNPNFEFSFLNIRTKFSTDAMSTSSVEGDSRKDSMRDKFRGEKNEGNHMSGWVFSTHALLDVCIMFHGIGMVYLTDILNPQQ